jgi:hypothetical protein
LCSRPGIPEWYLLLDADELVEAARFRDWFLNSGDPDEFDVIELACYTYGTSTVEQMIAYDHAGLLIRRSAVAQFLVLNKQDRYFYKDPLVFPTHWRVKLLTVHHTDFLPMVHHYSYTRASKALLKAKLLYSGHSSDKEHEPDNNHAMPQEMYELLSVADPSEIELSSLIIDQPKRLLSEPVFKLEKPA